MRDLDDKFKLSARGIQESAQAWDDLAALVKHRLRWRTFEAEPSRVTKQAVVNAVALYLAGLPREDRIRVVSEGMATLDRCLASDVPLSIAESPKGERPGGEAVPTGDVLDARLPDSGFANLEGAPPKKGARKRAR